jgi:hypothetical protein
MLNTWRAPASVSRKPMARCSSCSASCSGSGTRSDKRREKFVKMCADKDVQRLTWESYLNKKLVRKRSHGPCPRLPQGYAAIAQAGRALMWPEWVIAYRRRRTHRAAGAWPSSPWKHSLILLFLAWSRALRLADSDHGFGRGPARSAFMQRFPAPLPGSLPSGWCWPLSPMPPTWAHGCSAATDTLRLSLKRHLLGHCSNSRSPCTRLLHPNYHSGGAEIAGNWPPAWVAYLAGSLKSAGFTDVVFVDAMTNELSDDELRARMREIQPDVVGTTAITPSIYGRAGAGRSRRKSCPSRQDVLGGVHPPSCTSRC